MYNILICDDDRDIVSALDIYLTSDGYQTFHAYDGLEALQMVKEHDIHLILMDIMMPGMDGIRTTAKLRETENIPIIFLTAKSEDADKILGLNIGADDYVTKPFNPIEVLARVKSQLRRYTTLGGQHRAEDAPQVFRNGGIALDDAAKSVTVDGEPVSLTPIEYNILLLLMKHPPGLLHRPDLRAGVERPLPGVGKHCGRPHPPPAGKAGDRPGQSPVHQGGLGPGLQNGEGLTLCNEGVIP